ncbi:hypothetical protein ABW51_09500 [Haemophilus sp. C1]|uniref:hypothetical protein n=1 Tax=Haemophilus sp. C1 TaxID=1661745 RepID=UPI0006ABC112|nr:hypothetical protein [Haemophilus sp. C1]KOQ95456.1 hypothetical protein ABW51_09500 [Haemophilus sp. C1]
MSIFLIDEVDVQQALAIYLHYIRKQKKLSRVALFEKSGVPAATIKKFELTGQISLRQFLLLWQSLDDLQRLYSLVQMEKTLPKTIEEVIKGEF